ncbi:unnamed protein product [Prorocentrum cordatum]|uniref:Spindle pole body component n=1 Tax=Prorocentrum cordatum TaxID=2364126 RepID=A0ABN9T2Z2_9DINO|nr:unnamed protein product [Polarella glacialis]
MPVIRVCPARGPGAAAERTWGPGRRCGAHVGRAGEPDGSEPDVRVYGVLVAVRQMMLRAVRALHVAGGAAAGPAAGAVESQFHLLLASANEFLADTFLAEEYPGNDSLDIARYLACLKHLRRSARCLSDYLAGPAARAGPEDFAQSIRRLEERVRAKRTNAHLSIVRLRQRQPWREGDQSLRTLGAAVQELDEAEAAPAWLQEPVADVGQMSMSRSRNRVARCVCLEASPCACSHFLLDVERGLLLSIT